MSFKNIISFLIGLITFFSIIPWSNLPLSNYPFWVLIQVLFFVIILVSKKYYSYSFDYKNKWPVVLFLSWIIISVFRGVLEAKNYWEWKNLGNSAFVLLMVFSVFIFTNLSLLRIIFRNWFFFLLPIFFLVFPFFSREDALGHYLVPITFLLLMFRLVPKKWKVISLFFLLIVVLLGITARSNVIKFAFAFIFGLIYYLRFFITKKILNYLRLILLISPIVLFILGITGVFNVFKISDYVEGDYTANVVVKGKQKDENLTADTRTFLYIEVLSSAINNKYIYFGRTPARGNDSQFFGKAIANDLGLSNNERFSNEVSILNIFTWTGLVGVVLYFGVFFFASSLAINKSNNIFSKIIGLFVSFRWLYAWVEDFSRFDLSNLILWILISLCFSIDFRRMTNREVDLWVKSIFANTYITYNNFNYKKVI